LQEGWPQTCYLHPLHEKSFVLATSKGKSAQNIQLAEKKERKHKELFFVYMKSNIHIPAG
jgi:hypothetical protein